MKKKHLHDTMGELLMEATQKKDQLAAADLTTMAIRLCKLSDAIEEWRKRPSHYTERRIKDAHDDVIKGHLAHQGGIAL